MRVCFEISHFDEALINKVDLYACGHYNAFFRIGLDLSGRGSYGYLITVIHLTIKALMS